MIPVELYIKSILIDDDMVLIYSHRISISLYHENINCQKIQTHPLQERFINKVPNLDILSFNEI